MVELTRIKGILLVSPGPHIDVLKPVLGYTKTQRTQGPGGVSWVPSWHNLYAIDSQSGCLVCPCGALELVKELLTKAGHKYHVVDKTKRKVGKADMSNLGELRPGQLEVLQAIADADMGVVDAATGIGKSILIDRTCRMYPNAKSMIITKHQSVAKQLYEVVSKSFPKAGLWMSGMHKLGNPLVCTSGSLGAHEVYKYDLIQLDECHELLVPSVLPYMSQFDGAKVISYSASPDDRMDGGSLLSEVYLGRKIAKVPYQDAVKLGAVVQIRALFIGWETFGSYGLSNIKFDVAKHRKAYWNNESRNNMVCRTVYDVVPKYCSETDPQILILADKTEHVLRLAKLLPDFQPVYGAINKEDEKGFRKQGLIPEGEDALTKKDLDELKSQFSSGKLKKAIATSVWNTGADFPNLAVVIRVDGGASKIKDVQTPGRVARINKDKEEGLLIDFSDTFDSWASVRSKKRRKNYKSMGWEVEDLFLKG